MKNKYFIIVLLLYFQNSFAQSKKVFEENFTNNNKEWLEVKDNKYDFFFRNGKYWIVNNVNFFYGEQQKINIDENEDFKLETSISLNWKEIGIGYFVFGANSRTQNYYYLAFDSNNCYIGKFIDGKHITTSHKIKTNNYGAPNKIEIKKKKEKISFYFNDKKVLKKNFEEFFSNEFGFGVSGKQNISIDYLVAYQNKNNILNEKNYTTPKEKVTYTYEDNRTKVILKKKNGVYHIPVELNDVLNIDFIFDSGASDVSITPEVALTLIKAGTIKDSDWLEGAYYQFADGSVAESKRFKLKSVQVGNKIINNVVCSISNNLNAPMLLGQSVLEKFGKYTFDYETNQLIIN